MFMFLFLLQASEPRIAGHILGTFVLLLLHI